MPEAANGCVLCFLKNFAKNHRKTPVLKSLFLMLCRLQATPFTEQLWSTASGMWTLQKRIERNRLSLLQRGGCNAYRFGSSVREACRHPAFMVIFPTVSHKC